MLKTPNNIKQSLKCKKNLKRNVAKGRKVIVYMKIIKNGNKSVKDNKSTSTKKSRRKIEKYKKIL